MCSLQAGLGNNFVDLSVLVDDSLLLGTCPFLAAANRSHRSHLQADSALPCPLSYTLQAGLSSIFISRSLLVDANLLLEPRLSSASALAAATAMQYFGLLLLPRGPEDDWLMRGLAGWLEGQGLKTVAGNNELQYKRWQVRLAQ